jgi:predicted nicotinamide N-methyase
LAGQVLAHYLLGRADSLVGKRVCELGAGVTTHPHMLTIDDLF